MADPAGISPPRAEVDDLIALLNAGRLHDVVARGDVLLGRFPGSFVLYDVVGLANSGLDRFEQAATCFRQALAIDPGYAVGHRNLGVVLQNMDRLDDAIACYEQAVRITPDDVGMHLILGDTYLHVQRMDDAIACYERVLSVRPDDVDAHYNLAVALKKLGRMDEAAASYRRVIAIMPDDAEVYFALGSLLAPLGRLDEAVTSLEQALRINPDHAQASHFLGVALHRLGRVEEAVSSYERALQLDPDDAEAHYNLGIAFQSLDRLDEMTYCYRRALRLNPDHAEAHYNLGIALQNLGRLDEAISHHEHTLRLNPDHVGARSQKLNLQAHICDWDGLLSEAGLISGLGVAEDVASPFAMLSLDDDPQRNRIRSELCAAKHYPPSPIPGLMRPAGRPDNIRIGYFSADFHEHAVMHCMARLFELHDRSRFSVHLFSYGPDSDSEMRGRLKKAADAFHEVRDLTDHEVAEFARRQQIDIAVDLMGHTHANRLGIFAGRAAPIQISYLGYPGTLGTQFIDYIVADRVVIPEQARRHYSEKILYLPNSYQMNDNRRVISNRVITRPEMGLPEDGFVFCCFNNTFKIFPEEYDIWMRLLKRVEGSVLWLFGANKWAETNLRKETEKRGIDPDRLIFAERISLPEHMARHAQADLFLDTFSYNGHATASNALWAGLPLITRTGQGFAARVASSLLTAIGLPELITASSEEYERLALELATNRERLADIRKRLAVNRVTEPLFNSALFARHIESAYQKAYDDYFDGSDPADIIIDHP